MGEPGDGSAPGAMEKEELRAELSVAPLVADFAACILKPLVIAIIREIKAFVKNLDGSDPLR
jgi:hypothetical protein